LNDLQVLATKFCVRARPKLKAADTVEDLGGGAGEIDHSVFLLENWSECSLGMVLCARLNGTSLEALQGLDHQTRPHGSEARSNGLGGVVGCDRVLVPQKDVAGVEAGVDAHGGDAGDSFPVCDGPLNRRGAAVFRQERGVNVQAAKARQFEQRSGQDLSVSDDDNQVGLKFSERLNKVFAARSFRLKDRKPYARRQDFHGRRLRMQVPAFGPVGLRHDCGDGEGRRFQERR